MKFSETEGTGISNKTNNTSKVFYLALMFLMLNIQTVGFANNLNLFSYQDELIVITDLGTDDNVVFSGVMDDGFLEAIQTKSFTSIKTSNSDGTGSNSDGTGGTGSNSDGTGGAGSNSDGTGGGDSNSDGTGNKILSVVMDCKGSKTPKALGMVEDGKNSQTIEFNYVLLDGEIVTCDSEVFDNSDHS